ncbi:MAG: hypothetical protein KTR32_31095 [Granulosicoccus sp.]|nr:hypothetical protein [Granulosicoccus sp.]
MKDVKAQQQQSRRGASPKQPVRLEPLPKSLTYAAVVDVRNVEHEISEFMVRRACDEMDKMQQFPFAPR